MYPATELQEHLSKVRFALERARLEGDARVVASYEREVGRVEQLIANGGPPEPEPIGTCSEQEYARDGLLALALRHFVRPNDDPEAEATIWVPPLLSLLVSAAEWSPEDIANLLIPEVARQTARVWRLYAWQPIALDRLTAGGLYACNVPEALDGPDGVNPRQRERWRRWLAWKGFQEALKASHHPTRVRIGKGTGSGYVRNPAGEIVEVVPADQHPIAFAHWLSQAAPRYATKAMLKLAAELGIRAHDPLDGVLMGWPVDPATKALLDLADPEARDARAVEDEFLRRLYEEEDEDDEEE